MSDGSRCASPGEVGAMLVQRSGGAGLAAFVDPHLAGALPHGIQVPEAALALALSAFCLAVASPPTRR